MAGFSNIKIVLDEKVIELQALITEREGMIAKNEYHRQLDRIPEFTEFDFNMLAEKIRNLKKES